jgi:hypothetical protein
LIVTVAAPAQAGRIDATVAAPGPHDFAVRCRVSSARLLALTPQASIATRTTLRDDRETSLWRHGLMRKIVPIYENVNREFRFLEIKIE